MKTRALLVVLSLLSCAKKADPAALERAGRVLAQHLTENKRVVFSEPAGNERVWTDSALLERGANFPAAIEELLQHAPVDGAMTEGKASSFFASYAANHDGYLESKLERVGTRCEMVAGEIKVPLNCIYVDYLLARYPSGRFLVRAARETTLFVEDETMHAMLMPLGGP